MRHIAIALFLLPLAGQAQVMKCPDGSYSDQCSGGEAFQGGGVSSYSAPDTPSVQLNTLPSTRPSSRNRYGEAGTSASGNGPRSTSQRARSAGLSRNELVKARSRGIVLMGMAEKDVRYILGSPDSVDVTRTGRSTCRHLFWHHRIGTDYVKLCGDKVEYIDISTR